MRGLLDTQVSGQSGKSNTPSITLCLQLSLLLSEPQLLLYHPGN
jgi:hypothetical protein